MGKNDIDFLFLYQHKSRELENICLLRVELERRGYTVDFYNVWNLNIKKHPQYTAKVVIGPNISNDDCLYNFAYGITPKTKKIVNMQLEQVLTDDDNSNTNNIHNIKGASREVIHISWGEKNFERLVKNGVKNQNIIITGPIHMDFLRKEFREYYLNKEEMKAKYEIKRNQKISLIISSFAYENTISTMTKDRLKLMRPNFIEFVKLSVDSQKKILSWVEVILKKDKNIVFVYRPHPTEELNEMVKALGEKYANFRIIRDMSVKQWIVISDSICAWYSTSIAEVFFSGNTCSVLRPYPISEGGDLTICKNGNFVVTYEEFQRELMSHDNLFPLNEKLIRAHYDVNQDNASYIRICDLLEEMIVSNKYDVKINLKEYFENSSKKTKILRKFRKSYMYELYKLFLIYIAKVVGFIGGQESIRNYKKLEATHCIMKIIDKDQASELEISVTLNKIRKLIASQQ